jgi:hypothetical protein
MGSHLASWLAQHVFCPVVIVNQARFRWFVPLLLLLLLLAGFAVAGWYAHGGAQMLVQHFGPARIPRPGHSLG